MNKKQTPQEAMSDIPAVVEGFWKEFDDLPEEIQERRITIRDLKRKGMTNTSIAKLLNVHPQTISRELAWFKRIYAQYAINFSQDEEIGRSVDRLDEIEEKALAAYDRAMEDNERLIWVKGETGVPTQTFKNVPDHSSANRHLVVALQARKAKIDLFQKVGMMKVVPERSELFVGGRIDVSNLRGDELRAAEREVEARIIEVEEQLARIESPNPFKEPDHGAGKS